MIMLRHLLRSVVFALFVLTACGERGDLPPAGSEQDNSRAGAVGPGDPLAPTDADTVRDTVPPSQLEPPPPPRNGTRPADTIPARGTRTDGATTPAPTTARGTGIGQAATSAARDSLPAIVFLGNSLTAGYGLTPEEAYPALIQRRLDSAGYRYRVVNAGVSGDTSAGGLRRVDWVLTQPVAVLVLALGANDALRGQDLSATRRNLQAIIDRTRARHPDARIVIAGMQVPPNLGRDYTEEFRTMFIDLARENDAALIPFLLEGVATVPELNLEDGIHPNAAGQRILAENVWEVLEGVVSRGDA